MLEKIEIKKEDIKRKNKIRKSTLTVSQWIDICLDSYKTGVTEETIVRYRSKCKVWIKPVIGSCILREVTPLQCQNVLNRMQGKAMDTIKKVRELMFFIFEKALINRYIYVNPALNITLPRGGKTQRRSITDYERNKILEVAETDSKYTYFLFMLFCGLRPSEVAELQGRDITPCTVHVRGTKTRAADRRVPIPEYLRERLPDIPGPYKYLYTNARGGKLSLSNRQVLWRHFRRDLNIAMGCKVYRNELIPPYPVAPDLTPYCLRHTYCTDLMRAGVDIRTAQRLMGHASIRMTADIYTHVDMDAVTDAGAKLDTYINAKTAKIS